MAYPGIVTITIRKEVPSQEAAHALWELLKERIADRPDLKVVAHFNNDLDQD